MKTPAPDIIRGILEMVAEVCPGFTRDFADMVENRARHEYGGEVQRYIAKNPPPNEEARQAAVQEARRSGRVREAAEKHGISRATIYRLLKKERKK